MYKGKFPKELYFVNLNQILGGNQSHVHVCHKTRKKVSVKLPFQSRVALKKYKEK